MSTYLEMAKQAKPEAAAELAYVLLRIYEAHRSKNNGLVNGEAVLSRSFELEALNALRLAGVQP